MSYEIDHLFVLTTVGAIKAEGLASVRLIEGSRNFHPGQGTANRRYFFRNAMLELLWPMSVDEVRGEIARPTRLWERWVDQGRENSPFGVCLRPASRRDVAAPFSAWPYRPPYLPDGLTIHVAKDCPLTEPLWFYIPFGQRPDAAAPDRREPIEHPCGIEELTGVRVHLPAAGSPSTTAAGLAHSGLLEIVAAPEHLLELTFDAHRQGRTADFRPELPLTFRW